MRNQLVAVYGVLFVLCLFGFTGCGKGKAGGSSEGGAAVAEGDHGHEHAHGEEGPHGGHIIELGTEDYHAELTHDEANHRVGVYLLGGDAKTPAPIEAKSVMINVRSGGQPTQYELPAKPQAGEADGKSSYFELDSEPLCMVVCGESDDDTATARLSFNVADKPLSGMIETAAHDHDHDHGHDHDHE